MARRRERMIDNRPATAAANLARPKRGRVASDPRAAEQPELIGEDTLNWLATQPHLLDDYAGEWVAFADRTIVAHDPSFLGVMRQVEDLGIAHPFLFPVPPADFFAG